MDRAFEEEARDAFLKLKPVASDILESRNDAGKAREAIEKMRMELLEVSPGGLQSCKELVLFPILLVLETALGLRIPCKRDELGIDSGDIRCAEDEMVAESVFACYETVLSRTSCEGKESLRQALSRASAIATVCLGRDSEEAKSIGLQCLSSLVKHIECSESCSDLHAALCAPENAPALGHVLSIPISYAKEEMKRGSQGSKAILQASYRTLRFILEFVDDADAIAFFLPGIASGLFLTLQKAADAGPTVAAASTQAIVEAIYALSVLLKQVVSNQSNGIASRISSSNADTKSASHVLEKLHEMSSIRTYKTQSKCSKEDTPKFAMKNRGRDNGFRCQRDHLWLDDVAEKLVTMVDKTIPELSRHSQAEVRVCLTKLCSVILCDCSATLPGCAGTCIRSLLELSYDNFEGPSKEARRALVSWFHHNNQTESNCRTISVLLNSTFDELFVIENGNQVQLEKAFKQAAACMKLLGPNHVVNSCLATEDARKKSIESLWKCLSFDVNLTDNVKISLQTVHCKGTSRLRLIGSTRSVQQGQSLLSTHHQTLPRFTSGLRDITNPSLYKLVARTLRLLGQAAATCHNPSLQLAGMLGYVRRKILYESDAKPPGWRRAVASWCLITNELMYGASASCTDSNDDDWVGAEVWKACNSTTLVPHIITIVDLYMQHDLLGAPTASSEIPCTTLQEHGERCTMLRQLLEGIGVFAACLGPPFATLDARLLPLALCPLIERVADTSVSVADSAMVAILAVCDHCEYASPQELLAKNADYIVDELCKQLREPLLYPHCSQLMTAVLQSLDDTSTMFPLVTEPVRLASLMLTPYARRQNFQLSFHALAALTEAMRVTAAESQRVYGELKLESRKLVSSTPITTEDECETKQILAGDLSEQKDARDFFLSYLNSKQSPPSSKEKMEVLEDLLVGWRRELENISSISDIVVETIGPLFVSKCLDLRVLAMHCAQELLCAAEYYDRAIDTIEVTVEHMMNDRGTEYDIPNRKLLPYIAQLWPDLVQSFNEGYAMNLEGSFALLVGMVTRSKGTFLARRWIQEAWPACLRLLDKGIAAEGAGLQHADYLAVRQRKQESTSEKSLERTRAAVLSLLTELSVSSVSCKVFVNDAIEKMSGDLLAFGTSPYPIALQSQAIGALVALATVNQEQVKQALVRAIQEDERPQGEKLHRQESRTSKHHSYDITCKQGGKASVARLVLKTLQ